MSVISEVREILDESGVFYVDQQVFDLANLAQMELWADLRHDVVVATATVTANQTFLNIRSGISANMMIPQRVTDGNVEWFVTTHEELEREDRKWRTLTQGKTKWFVVWDAENLRLVPRPDQTYTYEFWGVRYPPTEIASGTLDITDRKAIKKALVFRTAALVVFGTRPDLAELWFRDSQEYLQRARKELRSLLSDRIWRVRPGKGDTWAHMGSRFVGKQLRDTS